MTKRLEEGAADVRVLSAEEQDRVAEELSRRVWRVIVSLLTAAKGGGIRAVWQDAQH